MSSITATIRQFQQSQRDGLATAATGSSPRLQRLPASGTNPGALNGWFYAPEATAAMALVVVLHGCTQSAAGYDRGSGWSDLAEQYGFAVLFPEQQRANNANLCFNWFLDEDTTRDGGEALSIRQMIETVSDLHAIDPGRVFVTGLSAGGAMANVMLATCPEVFAGGGIIAGLPYGAASSVPQALERMRGAGHATEAEYAQMIRRASSYKGPWPAISVWHGDADRTVSVANADAIVGQWRLLHGASILPDKIDMVDGQQRETWLGREGREAVTAYRIAGLGHGIPLKTHGPQSCGIAGAYMLEAGISSTWLLAQSWGLLNGSPDLMLPRPEGAQIENGAPSARVTRTPASDTQATIERALRSAGLMR